MAALFPEAVGTYVAGAWEILSRRVQGGQRTHLVALRQQPVRDRHDGVLDDILGALLELRRRVPWVAASARTSEPASCRHR